ncbi:MAG: hypothetical protein AB8B72_10425 [Crocinitomicaceae bacterium]
MINSEEIAKNYSSLNDTTLLELASEPESLTEEALTILNLELNERNIANQVQIRQKIEIDYVPEVSDELKNKFPNAKAIFGFETRSIIIFSVTFFALGALFILFSFSMSGYFSLVKYLGLVFWLISGLVWTNARSKKAMLVIFENEVLYKQKRFLNGSKLVIFDLVSLLFSSKYKSIQKSEIDDIVRPTNFTRLHNFYFKTKKGKKLEINFHARKEYLDQIHQYLVDFLQEQEDLID